MRVTTATKTTECERCGGSGGAGWSYEGGSQVDNGDCDRCRGTGRVRDWGAEDDEDLAATRPEMPIFMAELVMGGAR